MPMNWESLLALELVGGKIRVFVRGEGTYISTIEDVELLVEGVEFKTQGTLKEDVSTGTPVWRVCDNKTHSFQTDIKLLGGHNPIQFDTEKGFVVIYPRGKQPTER